MRFEMAAELRLTAETPAVGDFPNGFTAARVLQVSERRFQPQRPDPLADGSVASFEELVQVAAGNAVGEGNVLDRHRAIGEIVADVALDTRQVSEAYGAHAAAERSVIVFERQTQQFHQTLPQTLPGHSAQLLHSPRYAARGVEKQRARAAAGVVDIAEVAIENPDPALQHLRRQLQDPELVVFRVRELVRQIHRAE